MDCLFCQRNGSASKSVEHIIPESLGNTVHVLTKGTVCDSCNQYFAVKIEKKLLEQPYFRFVRNRLGIENKKRKIPIVETIIFSSIPNKVELMHYKHGQFIVAIPDDKHLSDYFNNSSGKLIIPVLNEPEQNNPMMSRFLAKVAVEALLLKVVQDESLVNEVLTDPGLELVKQYARFGKNTHYWPYHQRRIYLETARFKNRTLQTDNYEILHEWNFLHTDEHHTYFVLCIFGIEYAINLREPRIESYTRWLATNINKSTLDDYDETKVY